MAGKLSSLFKKETFLPSARKEQFWFETTDDSLLQSGDIKCNCVDFIVYVFKDVKKDKNGQDCELVDIKFFPYLINKQKGTIINIKTKQETKVDIKTRSMLIPQVPEEIKSYKRRKNTLQALNYMEFITKYFDDIKTAFPKNRMEKCLNCQAVRDERNMTTGDFIKICEKTEIEFKKNEQKRLKTKQAQVAQKQKKQEKTSNF